jgi:hypothetical protein
LDVCTPLVKNAVGLARDVNEARVSRQRDHILHASTLFFVEARA